MDSRRQTLTAEIAKLTAEIVSPEQIDTISDYLDNWENVSFEDKRHVLDLMIAVIRATNEKVQIEWKIWRGNLRRIRCPICALVQSRSLSNFIESLFFSVIYLNYEDERR